MKRITVMFLLFGLLTAAGCFKGTGDVLVTEDGSLFTGSVREISSGQVVFEHQSVPVTGAGRVWHMNGTSFHGTVTLSEGLVSAGTGEVPADSVLVILWGNTSVAEGSWEVYGGDGWLDTGMEISQGDMISISATGSVLTETGLSTPAGQEEYSSSTALVPGATSGQLVFKVSDTGIPAAAGDQWIGESPDDGILMVAVNVPLEENGQAEGSYTVHVTAGPGGRDDETTAFYPASSPI